MTPKQLTNFRLDEELLAALREIKDRDGMPIAVQVRRALEGWVKSKGVKMKSDRKHVVARKRS